MILTSQRSGSNFLEHCLDSHGEIQCFGEILLGIGRLHPLESPKMLDRLRLARLTWTYVFSGAALWPDRVINDAFTRTDKATVGFRCMYNQLARSRRALDCLLERRDMKVIHLRRKNLLRQYISRKQMHNRQAKLGKMASHTTKQITVPRVYVPPEKALAAMRQFVSDGKRFDELFGGHEKLNINYEDLFENGGLRPSSGKSLCEFLGVEATPMASNLKKMNRQRLEECVSNYDDLSSTLHETEFSELLTSEDY